MRLRGVVSRGTAYPNFMVLIAKQNITKKPPVNNLDASVCLAALVAICSLVYFTVFAE